MRKKLSSTISYPITQTQEIGNMFLLFALVLQLITSTPLPGGKFVGATPTTTTTGLGNMAKPGCKAQCGDLPVPYPFGIGKGCYLDESFEVRCDSSYNPPKLYLWSGNINVYSVSGSEMRIYNSVGYRCYNQSGPRYDLGVSLVDSYPFTFSPKNKFYLVGCDDYAWIRGPNVSDLATGCMGMCTSPSQLPNNGNCSGIGCCQMSIPKGIKHFEFELGSFSNHTDVMSFNPCSFAFLADENSFHFGGARDLSNVSQLYSDSYLPIVVDWVVGRGKRNCSQATECKGNSSCIDDVDIGGYRCTCDTGYQGNPYLDSGCQDINECEDNSGFPCYGNCTNTPGNYTCTCLEGYDGDAKIANGCRRKASNFPVVVLTLALVFGLFAILSGITGICFGIRKRKLIKLREKFFEQNGGEFMKQKLKTTGANDVVTIFSTEQLRKATDNYSKERIVGRGGYGVVYKGILPDKRVVAIKKSKLVDRTQAEQFINEVLILTQVIHRNVVKVLGCCLEEEVPILVYEFISNNTLFYHIHKRSSGSSWLSWEDRLRIAAEAAGALAYLHSQATTPIIHRDVKSANILLDENYTTKISDFGASRLIPLDQDRVTTLVQGTFGYLDPQYFRTSRLTDKSDAYSFGVVLAELITGQKPLCADKTDEEKDLATYFLKSMKENCFSQIIEPQVLREGTLEQLQVVAELARRCLNLVGENRPTMKEVAMELEDIRKFTQQRTLESRILIIEVEQSDVYASEREAYSAMTQMVFTEDEAR